MSATPAGPGCYRITHEGRQEVVYVAGPAGRRWAFWNGQVYREETLAPAARAARNGGAQPIVAPMPATVVKVMATAGQAVRKGDTLIIVEAMKMELPLRASADGRVRAVHCREGELVQPDRPLVDLE